MKQRKIWISLTVRKYVKSKKNIQEFIKQGDGTHDKKTIVDDTVKETEYKIGLVVGDNNDDDSENLVITEATVVESNSSSGKRKQVSFCFQVMRLALCREKYE